jgi:hypothetical protein
MHLKKWYPKGQWCASVMLGEISFAGRKAHNIKCPDTKARILKELAEVHKTRIIQRHHERFTDAHINKLSTNPYMVTLRTNGNPYLLYLTRINFVNQCIFIDKKIQQGYSAPRMIIARFAFDDGLFDGTLLDGEMAVDNEGTWLFLVGDMVAHCGVHLENVNAIRRINTIYELFKHMFVADVFDVCRFQVKRYYKYEEIGEILNDFVPHLNYSCRGIYFKPMYLKFSDILYNFDDSLIKKVYRQKYASESKRFLEMEDVESGAEPKQAKREKNNNPTDMCVVNVEQQQSTRMLARRTGMPDVYVLEDVSTGKEIGNACVPTMEASKFMRALFKDKNINDRIEIECRKSDSFSGKWVPVQAVTRSAFANSAAKSADMVSTLNEKTH